MPARIGKDVLRQVVDSYREHDLLSYASAIAFQALFALLPAALAAIALLGFLDLEDVWREDVGPAIQERVEPDAYSVVERTVTEILGERRGLWLTFGLAFALWQVSGAVRATMAPLNAIYHEEEERSLPRRFLTSFLLAPGISACIAGALLSIHAGDAFADRFDGLVRAAVLVLRWPLAVAALAVATWLLLRFAPARRHAVWASIGVLFVLAAWIGASLAFAAYATRIASYGSVFGSLASAIVLLTYLYLSAGAFLFGAQLDACVRERALREEEEEQGSGPRLAGQEAGA